MSANKEKRTAEQTADQKLAVLFFDLYKGLDRAHGKYTVTQQGRDGKKTQGRATTEIAAYVFDLWTHHLYGSQGLGVVPIQDDSTCWWGAIDIDKYDLDLVELEKEVRKLELPLLTLRTKSGGAHLVLFLAEALPCKLVRAKLYEFALALGYGDVEIFPKQSNLATKNDVGNWLNMPYFDHRKPTRYAILNGEPLSALQFLELAKQVKITEDQLMAITPITAGEFDDGPPCLQMITKNGKVPEGTRNATLFAMGVYARKKYDDDWEDKVSMLNSEFISPPLKIKEVSTVCKSLGRKDYFYPCTKPPLSNSCNRELCRKRIYGIGEAEEEFTLNLGALVKVNCDPPIWIIDIEGIRVEMETDDLVDQTRFRKACVKAINRLPPRIKGNEWDKIIRGKLETVETVDAPKETRTDGRVTQYADAFVENTPWAEDKSEISMGRPYFDPEIGALMFRGNDLIRYLENNGIRLEPRRVWSALKDSGLTHRKIRVRSSVYQVWILPLNKTNSEHLSGKIEEATEKFLLDKEVEASVSKSSGRAAATF